MHGALFYVGHGIFTYIKLNGNYRLQIVFGAIVKDDQPGNEKKLSRICTLACVWYFTTVAVNCSRL